jgi:hypothetical protein
MDRFRFRSVFLRASVVIPFVAANDFQPALGGLFRTSLGHSHPANDLWGWPFERYLRVL